jgi:hypothetical protein
MRGGVDPRNSNDSTVPHLTGSRMAQRCFPNRPFIAGVAKAMEEPILADAAPSANVCIMWLGFTSTNLHVSFFDQVGGRYYVSALSP